jgi:hypothetical protein
MRNIVITGLIAGSIAFAQAPYGIATIAGTPYDPSGDGGPALLASFGFSAGSVAWRDGNLYVTDGPRVRKINPAGIVNTVVGTLDPVVHQPIAGYSGDGGPALGAKLRSANALEFDSSGNLYVGDQGNFCVRKITASVVGGVPQPINGTETITTFAGKCTFSGNGGDGGPATAATMIGPLGMSFNPATGDLYIADQYNNNVRKVDALGTITTVAGTGAAGSLGDGGPATLAELNFPLGVSVDPATGDLYIADAGNHSIRKVHAGIITTVTAAGGATKVSYRAGSLYLLGGGEIRKLDSSNTLTTLAGTGAASYTGPFPPIGDGGPATAAFINSAPSGYDFAFDNSGIYVIDGISGRARYVANSTTTVFGQFVLAGNITTVAGPGGVVTFSGDGGPAISARLYGAWGIAVDPAGTIYVADNGNNRIRAIDPSRTINTIAGNGSATLDTTHFPITPTTTGLIPQLLQFNNGALYATHSYASVLKIAGGLLDFAFPPASIKGASNIAFDPDGILYVVDPFAVVVWAIDPVTLTPQLVVVGGSVQIDGVSITSAPANQIQLLSPGSAAFDPAGNLYLVESGKNRILKVAARGYQVPLNGTETVTIYAGAGFGFSGDGGPATAALLAGPTGLATDAAGNLYFSDGVNFRIRKIDTLGIITTIAGSGTAGFAGDGGPALAAQIRMARLAIDSTGTIFFTDGVNNVVRVLAPFLTSGNNCNGTYIANFTGNVNVTKGQTCILVGGHITGNITQTGGSLSISSSQISGNLQVNGGGSFSIGPSTTIGGNLQIQNLPGGTAPSQVCGATVNNDLTFQSSAAAVMIGSTSPACAGNTIGGNLTIQSNTAATTVDGNTVKGNLTDQSNTAPTQVFTNAVGNNLTCQNNSSISRGGNTAKSKQGQCSAF